MSLINKMLQDLDARGNARTGEVPLEVKPVRTAASTGARRRIAAITAALLAVALGVSAFVLLPIKGKTFDARPPAQVAPPAAQVAPAVPAPEPEPAPVTVAEVAVAASAPAAPPAVQLAAQEDPAPAAAPEPEEAVAPRNRAAAPAAPKSAAPAPAPRVPRDTPMVASAAAPAAPAASTTTWAVASARARAEQERLAQRWAAEEARIAALPPGERAAAARRLRAEQDRAAQKTRADAAWVATLKRKEIAAGTFPGEAGADDSRPANPVQGRSETALQRADNGYRRALASLQDGRVAEAIAGLQAALRANPKHDAARQILVGLLIENRRSDEAVAELQQGLALDARQPALAMLLARLQIERGGSGIETLLRTLPYAAGNGEYHGFLAGALQRQGRHREAAEQYQAALRSAPDNAVWWMGLGISLQADKRNAEALDAFRKARDSGALSQELQGFVERRIAQLAR